MAQDRIKNRAFVIKMVNVLVA